MKKIQVPGKLILSGEHAVIYGCPALALAVEPCITATVSVVSDKNIIFDLPNINYYGKYTFSTLAQLRDNIKKKYQDFRQGKLRIDQVITAPSQLAAFALAEFLSVFSLSPPTGLLFHIDSALPIGSGMGSSAATILGILFATALFLLANRNSRQATPRVSPVH